MKKFASLSVLFILLFSVVAAGCIGGETKTGTQTEGKGITLVVLTRHDVTIQVMAKRMFLQSDIAKQYNIRDIKFIKAPESLWPTYIEKGADVGWGGGPTLFDDLFKNNYLAPIDDQKVLGLIGAQIQETIAGMPMVRKGNDGKIYWIAAALSSFGFTVNHDVLKRWNLPVPQTWEEIASETFAMDPPQVGIADPTRSTSNTRIYQIILQAFGWDEGWKILTLIAANSKIYDASDAVREAVIAGDIAVGNTIDFYGYTAMKLNPACEYIIPKGQSIINGDPIALLVNSQNKEAAQAFIYWVLTEGQKIWLDEEINRLPVNPSVFDTPEGQKRPDLKKAYESALKTQGIEFDDNEALATVNSMQLYFKATLVDANQELHRAWVSLVNAYREGRISEEKYRELKAKLLEPVKFKDPDTGETVTLTEEYAKKINDRLAKDSSFRDTLMQEWRDAAREKYQSVLTEVQG
ncbi:Phosphoglycerate transport regulatory protein PgtC [Thermococcus sp. 2319x1]|uniref:ABC transporter substrate-binding protein n=1 Tax=Thermococcus sp. 2319x1 TaxID=1674923 RepID=UPI00073AD546|nr:ABC transporter substrate-binding protein [Thermococcus sp. 2319x1]ALV61861.1 Phosphoglycerate transport regulatory protein PgtC [Thermococcus sp. 2319x1]